MKGVCHEEQPPSVTVRAARCDNLGSRFLRSEHVRAVSRAVHDNGSAFYHRLLVLLIVCLLRRRTEVGSRRDIIVGSLICGAALFAAANLQQLAINMGASAGKANFVTALYIVLVPVGQIFFKHTLPSRHWIAVAVAVTGMYFLCITDGFSISSTDLILLMCAFLFTIQILSVDRFSFRVDGLVLSCGMFLVVSLLSALVALPFEEISVSAVRSCIWPLLYISVFSKAALATLRSSPRRGGNPRSSLLLSRGPSSARCSA